MICNITIYHIYILKREEILMIP